MMRTHVTLPRLVTEGHIDILVDTGAQVTCILGADAGILNVPYESLSQPATLRGVGGTTVMYREPAILTFRDTENGRIYWNRGTPLGISSETPGQGQQSNTTRRGNCDCCSWWSKAA